VAVLGLARSGLAAAQALRRAGAAVLAWDDAEAARAAAAAAGIPLADPGRADLADVALLVLSPGIPHSFPAPHPAVARVRAAGIPIAGDIDLLARALPAVRKIGITGTNGKSTTTALIGHVLDLAGLAPAVGGNLGIPVLGFEPPRPDGILVLELSSYQLELSPALALDVAVLLNITPDHLARHGGMDGYIRAKTLVFRHGTRPLTAVVGVDDAPCRAVAAGLRAEGVAVVEISAHDACAGISAAGGVLRDNEAGVALDLHPLSGLPGAHNWQNAAAAWAACRAIGVTPAVLAPALASFPGLAHRQQRVGAEGGIVFVNDSKATNADAAAKALACYPAIYWIAGGQAKEGGLAGLEALMPRIRHAFLIGEAEADFAAWLEGKAAFTRCGTLDRAVALATAAARRDIARGRNEACVLLSPACASWDQFSSFEQRGAVFAALVADQMRGVAGGAT
jgi:UDP-N-acetylmuramoylalanine--D-glutamate ligase